MKSIRVTLLAGMFALPLLVGMPIDAETGTENSGCFYMSDEPCGMPPEGKCKSDGDDCPQRLVISMPEMPETEDDGSDDDTTDDPTMEMPSTDDTDTSADDPSLYFAPLLAP